MKKTVYKCDICGSEDEYDGYVRKINLPCFCVYDNGSMYSTFGRYCHIDSFDLCPACEEKFAKIVMGQFAKITRIPGVSLTVEQMTAEGRGENVAR